MKGCKLTEVEKFDCWLKSRTSYTLRGFHDKVLNNKPVISKWNILYSSDILDTDIDIKKTMIELVINSKLETIDKLLNTINTQPIPIIISCNNINIKMKIYIIDTGLIDNNIELNILIDILMPLNDQCSLQWMFWPDSLPKPNIDQYKYHDIKPVGKMVAQPRLTACFGKSYNFSGSTHKIEENTPDVIENLFTAITTMCNIPIERGPNMCLVNHYTHGRHCIGEHSDDERAMNYLKNVYCFCEGDSRELILRFSKKQMNKIPTSPFGTTASKMPREVVKLIIPEGLYIMNGENFQKGYTHQIPEVYPSLFKKIQKTCLNDIKNYPDYPRVKTFTENNADRTHLLQADWIAVNSDIIKKLL